MKEAATDVPGELNVTGEGNVKAKPDVAWVRLGVLTEAKTAVDATAQNAAKAKTLVNKMLALGIARDAMRTSGLLVAPVYETLDGAPRIVSYRVEDSITIECAVEQAGQVFDEGIEAGANQSSGLSFGLRDDGPHRCRALEAAVAAARADAGAVAAAMGVTLKGVRHIDIDPVGVPVMFKTARADRATADTPVLGGDLTVTARVRFVFVY